MNLLFIKILAIICMLSFAKTKTLGAQDNVFVCKAVKVSFFSSAPIEDIAAHTEKGVSALNTQNKKIYFKIPIRSFEFQKSLMQEHFNENYMESDDYPYATFSGNIISDIDFSKEGSYPVEVDGDLSVHGVTKHYREKGKLVIGNGSIMVSAEFKVRLADHKIDIPEILFMNIAEVLSVKIDANYSPKK